jgi:tetratricopeptide (TPR) repeat protein
LYTSAFGQPYPGIAFLPSAPLVNDPLFDAAAVAVPGPAQARPALAPAPEPAPPGQPKATNPEQKAKAGKFLTFGDTNFASQKYLAALGRYKTAAQVAPDLGEPYFRQGHTHVALGQYDSAIKAFRRGLRIEGDWTASPFRLEQLYGGDVVAKTGHLENLAKAVEANPFSTDLLTLLGLELFFDGQRERSLPFFERAAQLGGNEERLLDDFLPKPAPAGEPQPPLKPAKPVQPAKAVKVVF